MKHIWPINYFLAGMIAGILLSAFIDMLLSRLPERSTSPEPEKEGSQ